MTKDSVIVLTAHRTASPRSRAQIFGPWYLGRSDMDLQLEKLKTSNAPPETTTSERATLPLKKVHQTIPKPTVDCPKRGTSQKESTSTNFSPTETTALSHTGKAATVSSKPRGKKIRVNEPVLVGRTPVVHPFERTDAWKNVATRTRYVDTLKLWTGKSHANVVFDSERDEFTEQGLFSKVKGKENIAVVAFTADGDVFGGFYSVAVVKQDVFYDPNIFAFSLESHGRCTTPQPFAPKVDGRTDSYVFFYKNDKPGWFLSFGGWSGYFSLGNERSGTCCYCLSWAFSGVEDTTFTGKSGGQTSFVCTRLVAVQLM